MRDGGGGGGGGGGGDGDGGSGGTWHDKLTAVQHARLIPNPTFLSLSGLQLYGNHRPTLIGFPNLLSLMKQKLPSDWNYFQQTQPQPLPQQKGGDEWNMIGVKIFCLLQTVPNLCSTASSPPLVWSQLSYLGQFDFFSRPKK